MIGHVTIYNNHEQCVLGTEIIRNGLFIAGRRKLLTLNTSESLVSVIT